MTSAASGQVFKTSLPSTSEFFALFFLAWTVFGLLNAYPGHVHSDTAEIDM